jgi:hypothetical protein
MLDFSNDLGIESRLAINKKLVIKLLKSEMIYL